MAPFHRDDRCVFVGNDPSLADLVVAILSERGIEARVMSRATLGGILGLTPWSVNGVASGGIEVWVDHLEQADEARQIIDEHQDLQAQTRSENKDLGPVRAECEQCGQISEFAGEHRGTVQVCPHCRKYLDVPGSNDEFDWSIAEGTEAEDAN